MIGGVTKYIALTYYLLAMMMMMMIIIDISHAINILFYNAL